jgi:AraC-like DNA-binding protein
MRVNQTVTLSIDSSGGLAPWRARRVSAFIEANIEQRMTAGDAARVVNLSTSHFSRAFKRSFGQTVHGFIMRKRIERAQQLMLSTSDELSSIAISCGLSDQSHLTRWFRRVVGETPGSWRRAAACGTRNGGIPVAEPRLCRSLTNAM